MKQSIEHPAGQAQDAGGFASAGTSTHPGGSPSGGGPGAVARRAPAASDGDLAADPYAELKALAEHIRALDRVDLMLLSGMLLEELAGAKAEQLTKAELRVRAETLAGRAKPAGAYGRLVCPICGQPKQPRSLGVHILRQHADQLAAMPSTSTPTGPRVAG